MVKLSEPLLKPSYCQLQPPHRLALERFARALQIAGRAPGTVQSYLSVLQRLARYVPDLLSPTPDALRSWARAEGKRLARSSYNLSLTAARTFYREMYRWEYCPVDHGVHLPPSLRAPQRLPRTLEPDQIAALRSAPDLSSYVGFRDHVILSLLVETGLRARELIALTCADVLPDPAIFVRGERRRSDRVVPITSDLFALLQAYHRWRALQRPGKQARLFLCAQGKPFNQPAAIWRIVTRYAHAVSITGNTLQALARTPRPPGPSVVKPTILRASLAAQLLNRGVDVRTVQVWLGHKDVQTTARYEVLDLRALRAAHAKRFAPPRALPTKK